MTQINKNSETWFVVEAFLLERKEQHIERLLKTGTDIQTTEFLRGAIKEIDHLIEEVKAPPKPKMEGFIPEI